MFSFCLKCGKITESKNPKISWTKKFIKICSVCNSKKTKLIKEHEASGLLSSLGIKRPLGKIP